MTGTMAHIETKIHTAGFFIPKRRPLTRQVRQAIKALRFPAGTAAACSKSAVYPSSVALILETAAPAIAPHCRHC
jgi:hypothetical protein